MRASWVRRLPDGTGHVEALVSLQPRVNLLVRVGPDKDRAHIELWSGEPDRSDGIAVTIADDRPAGLYRIPLCACGERRCGNAGLQLSADVAASDLPELAEVVSALSQVPDRPARGDVWDGTVKRDTGTQLPIRVALPGHHETR